MGLLSINASTPTPAVAGVVPSQNVAAASGGGLSYGVQQAVSGAMSSTPGSASSIIKRMLVGGVAGAALGFGASFLTLPVIGQVAAPIAAAVGGGIGAALGLISGLLARRKARAAAAQQTIIAPGAGVAPNIIPQSVGKTIHIGQSGSTVKQVQRNLKALGLYNGKITGKFDHKLADAVRTYEIMKGVVPTGQASAQMRSALAQDVAYKNRYV